MGSPSGGNRRRRHGEEWSERGYSLLEVLVSMVVLLTVLVGVSNLVSTALTTGSNSRLKQVATDIASSQLDSDLASGATTLLSESGFTSVGTVSRGSVAYTIEREVTPGSGACAAPAVGVPSELTLTEFVTWSHMASGRTWWFGSSATSNLVRESTFAAVPASALNATEGDLLVTVTDYSGNGQPSVTVTAVNSATGAAESAVTTTLGCVLFANLPTGSWSLSATATGWIDNAENLNTSASQTFAITAGSTQSAVIKFAPAATVTFQDSVSAVSGVIGTWQTPTFSSPLPLSLYNSQLATDPYVAVPAASVYPFGTSPSYTVVAGSCGASSAPDGPVADGVGVNVGDGGSATANLSLAGLQVVVEHSGIPLSGALVTASPSTTTGATDPNCPTSQNPGTDSYLMPSAMLGVTCLNGAGNCAQSTGAELKGPAAPADIVLASWGGRLTGESKLGGPRSSGAQSHRVRLTGVAISHFGTASQLVFSTQPSGSVGEGVAFTQPTVKVEDASGNTVTSSSAAVTLSIEAYTPGNGGSTEGTLSCTTNPVTSSSGVASFSGCAISGSAAAGTYTLEATSPGLTTVVAASNVTVTAGSATQLAFSTQPVGQVPQATHFATSPVVSVEDANGNTVTSSSAHVTLAIDTYSAGNGGTTQGTLSCGSNPDNASSGLASFSNCEISGSTAPGTYTLQATASGLTTTPASSNVIITGSATALAFSTQPSGTVGEASAFTEPTVWVEDSYGNLIMSSSAAVTLAIEAYSTGNGGTTQGSITGCVSNPVTSSSGVASFSSCKITGTAAAGTYTLEATSSGLTTVVASSTVTITAGSATKLAFSTQPSGSVGEGVAFTEPTVNVQDANANTVTSSSAPVTLVVEAYTSGNGGNTQGSVTGCVSNPVTSSSGVASFSGCAVSGTAAAGTYTLEATSSGLTTVVAASNVTVTAGSAAQLGFSTQPGGTVGEGVAFTQPTVKVQDANANTITSSSAAVTLAVEAYSTGNGGTTQGSITGCTANPVTSSSGVASFSSCKITGSAAAGTYTLEATSSGLTTVVASSTVTITAGSATKLAFSTQPSGTVGEGVAFTEPTVWVEDANSNTVTSSSAAVTLAIEAYTAGNGGTTQGSITGCGSNPVTSSSGVASFSGCAVSGTAAAGTYTLEATSSGLTTVVAASNVTVTAGSAAQLGFSTQPGGTVGEGVAFTQPTVKVQDANANTVTSSSAAVTLAVEAYSTGNGGNTQGSVTGCGSNPVTSSSGVASFSGCAISGSAAAGTYTLQATSPGLTTVVAASNVTVTAGSATQLAFSTQPVGQVPQATHFATSPVVSVEDANGNTVTSSSAHVTLAIDTYSAGNGGTTQGTLSCGSNPDNASSGLASFSNCEISGSTAPGTYTLQATASGLTTTPASSNVIITGSATALAFSTQPSGTVGEASAFTEPTVWVEDSYGNLIMSSSAAVTLAIEAYSTGNGGTTQGSITGCVSNPVTSSSGVASFSSCKITGTAAAGTYTLEATSSGLTTVVASSTVTITAGSATKLAFSTQPSGSVGEGVAFTEPTVNVQDANANTVTSSSAPVTLVVEAYTSGNGGNTQGSVTGCVSNPVTSSSGVASFSGCAVSGTAAAGTYTLEATSSGLTTVVAASNVTVTAGSAAQLGFSTQPGGTVGEGVAFTQPTVKVQDANANTITSSSAAVTLAVEAYSTGNGGTTQGSITGCTANPVTSSSGVASFSSCKITGSAAAGTYTLEATSSGLTTVVASSTVTITAGSATKLAFSTQPSGTVGEGVAFTEPTVKVQDANSNTVTSSSAAVTLAVEAYSTGNGGTTQGSITGCVSNPVTSSSGVASFSGCAISGTAAAGTYTLEATSSGLTTVVASSNVTITAGSATKLAFSTQPGGTVGEAVAFTQPTVKVQDANANTVTSSSAAVTLLVEAYAAGNGGNTQGSITGCGSNPVTSSSGVASFSGCAISGSAAAGTYTLEATSSGLTTVVAASNVTVTAGSATKLAFSTQPVGQVPQATHFATSPVVSVEDANANTVTSSNAAVTLSIDTYSAGNGGTTKGTLSCGSNPDNANSGLASFSNCEISGSTAPGTYTLQATGSGLTTTLASSNVIITGSATALAFSTQPSGTVGEASAFTEPTVWVEDSYGNLIMSSSAAVTLAIEAYSTGNGGTTQGSITGCTANPVTSSSGVASFSSCKITGSSAAGTYTLEATSSGLTTAVASSTVTITAGSATKLAFSTQPSGTVGEGVAFTEPTVWVEDANSNTVTSSSAAVTLVVEAYSTGNGGTTQGSITGCVSNPVTSSSGVASFSGCAVSGTAAAGTYTLEATSSGLTTVVAASNVTVTAGSAAQLGFSTQPTSGQNIQANGTGSFPVTAQVLDTYGNLVTSSSAAVALAITNGTGTSGAALSCTNTGGTTVSASSGAASFSGCAITLVGSGYTLTASSSGLTSTVGNAFNIIPGSAAQLAFSTQPSGSVVEGAAFTQPTVVVDDADGNMVTSSSAAVTLVVEAYTAGNGGTTQGSITGCVSNPVTSSSGVASFSGCAITGSSASGTYTLEATSFGLTTVVASSTVSVSPAASTVTLASGANPSVDGQAVTFTATVSAVSPGAGTPTGTVTFDDGATTLGTATLVFGVATFTTTALPQGTDSITAVYGGSGSFLGCTSAPLSQVVGGDSSYVLGGLPYGTFALTATYTNSLLGESFSSANSSITVVVEVQTSGITVYDNGTVVGVITPSSFAAIVVPVS